MGHILIFLHKIVVFKILAILLSVGMVVVVFQLSGTFKAHALNVHTEIKANPPGIVKIIDRTGNPPPGIVNPTGAQPPLPTSGSEPNTSGTGLPGEPPPDGNGNNGPGGTPGKGNSQSQTGFIPPGLSNIRGGGGGAAAPAGAGSSEGSSGPLLTINTNIDFGTVFPGETVTGNFTIYLTGVDNTPWVDGPYTSYNVTMLAKMGYQDMKSSMKVQRDPNEAPETEPDPIADGPIGDYTAQGTLDSNDISDTWIVRLEVPDGLGDYWIEILIEVP